MIFAHKYIWSVNVNDPDIRFINSSESRTTMNAA